MNGHVFVSHGSEDSADANGIAALIESKGIKAWIAPRDVRPGQDYSEQLQAAIENCIAFVVLVTDKANKSPFVRAETEMAFSTSKPIFPVRMRDIQPAAGLAFFLKIRHWTDAFGAEREANVGRLMRELQTLAGVAVDPGTTPPGGAAAPPVPPAPAPSPPPPAPPPPAAPRPAQFVAAATPAPAPGAREPLPADTALIEAAIGPNAAYYIRSWREMDARNRSSSWNWAACLLNFFWLAYRKLWWPMIGFFFASLLLSLIGLGGATAAKASLLLQIGLTFITGGYGNLWYRSHTERLVRQTAGMSPAEATDWVRPRGGVSVPALVITLAIAALLGLLAAVGMVAARQARLNQLNQLNRAYQGATPGDPDNGVVYPDGGGGKPPPTDEQEQGTPPAV